MQEQLKGYIVFFSELLFVFRIIKLAQSFLEKREKYTKEKLK